MTAQEIIDFTNLKMNQITSGGKISEIGEDFIKEKYTKKEDDGGFSPYWKEVSFEDAKKLIS